MTPFTGAADRTTTPTGTPGQKAASLPTEAAAAVAVAITVVASTQDSESVHGHFRNLNWSYLPYKVYIRPM